MLSTGRDGETEREEGRRGREDGRRGREEERRGGAEERGEEREKGRGALGSVGSAVLSPLMVSLLAVSLFTLYHGICLYNICERSHIQKRH